MVNDNPKKQRGKLSGNGEGLSNYSLSSRHFMFMGSFLLLLFLKKKKKGLWMGLSRVLSIFFKLYFNHVFNWFMVQVSYQEKLLKLCFNVDKTYIPLFFSLYMAEYQMSFFPTWQHSLNCMRNLFLLQYQSLTYTIHRKAIAYEDLNSPLFLSL